MIKIDLAIYENIETELTLQHFLIGYTKCKL